MKGVRLDVWLVTQGHASSRTKAQSLITGGMVSLDNVTCQKPSTLVEPATIIEVRQIDASQWVSRGSLKLLHAFECFSLNATNHTIIDIGASTGGFTQVCLHHGAAHVYAVDVGHGQIDPTLRHDTRITVLEKTNARYLNNSHVPSPVDGIVCDASFINLRTLLPAALSLTKDRAWLCALIKPQFEAGKQAVGKGGIIRDTAIHQHVCDHVQKWINNQAYWQICGIIPSPIEGMKGNKEFLVYAIKQR